MEQVSKTVSEETLKETYGVEAAEETQAQSSVTAADMQQIETADLEELRKLAKQLLEEKTRLQQQVEEFKELAARRAAELENFRRRVEKEKEQIVRYANEKLLLELLPFIDDLHRAVESSKQQQNYEALVQGIELIYSKVMGILERLGVRPIETVGKPFDVELHEALMHIPHEAPEGQIVQEVQRGYLYGDKVLRHAKVITSAGKKGNDQAQTAESEKADS